MALQDYRNLLTKKDGRFYERTFKRFPTVVVDGKSYKNSGWVKSAPSQKVSDEGAKVAKEAKASAKPTKSAAKK